MLRQGAMHTKSRAGADTVVREEAPSEHDSALGVVPFARDLGRHGAGRGDEQGRDRRRRSDAAEPASQSSAEVEDAEVQPSRRLDEHGFARQAHDVAARRAASAARTYWVTNAIAPNSSGPAVLSTIT